MTDNRRKSNRYTIYSAFAAAGAVMVVALSAVLAVNAYLTAQTETKTNNFSPKNFTYTDTAVVEPEDNGYTYTINSSTGVLTSTENSAAKSAKVQNSSGTDKKPVFVRATMVADIYDSSGVNVTRKYADCVPTYTIDSGWTSGDAANSGKGFPVYYYYNQILNPGDASADLITGVTLSNPDKLDTNVTVKIRIIADTVQAVSDDSDKWGAKDYETDDISKAWGVTPTAMKKNGTDTAVPSGLTEDGDKTSQTMTVDLTWSFGS